VTQPQPLNTRLDGVVTKINKCDCYAMDLCHIVAVRDAQARIEELERDLTAARKQLAAANATVEKCKAAGFIDEQGNVASDVHHGGELRQSIELTEFQASVLDNIRHANDQSWKYHPHVPSETQAMETLESLGLVKQETYMVMRAAATCFNITDKGRQWLSQNGTAR
jgi:multidrug resistance efflux pump